MAGDRLFDFVTALQGQTPWGAVLDAGTGRHSLEWIAGLGTVRWTAVTGDPDRAAKLEREFAARMRPVDRIVAGNWLDPVFLHDEVYDTVLADYLLGAIDGFAPYFQDRLFARLRPLVRGTLYYVGLGPYPDPGDHEWGRIICEIARLRDACILLAAHRTYREYPLDWVLRHLEASGFEVVEARSFGIRYGAKFVDGQLDVCASKLPCFASRSLAREIEREIGRLRELAHGYLALHGPQVFGQDHVVAARAR